MSYSYYCVRSERGWVTRWDLTSPLVDNGYPQDAYCYDDLAKAIVIAKQFSGDVVKVVVAGKDKVRTKLVGAEWVPYTN